MGSAKSSFSREVAKMDCGLKSTETDVRTIKLITTYIITKPENCRRHEQTGNKNLQKNDNIKVTESLRQQHGQVDATRTLEISGEQAEETRTRYSGESAQTSRKGSA